MLEALLTKAFLAKAATVVAGLSLATTGAGAADVLPQVAQDKVAAAVETVTPLDLPSSQDAPDGTDPADGSQLPSEEEKAVEPNEVEKPQEADEAEKPQKPEKDNFGSIVSARARTTDDKGRNFGQSVSDEARDRAAARQEARAGDDTPDDDGAEDGDDEADEQDAPKPESRQRPATPGAQGNHGSSRGR